jgi:hypothetical protein
MNTQDFKRKLAAIVSADVAGYSRLMGDNESEMVKTIAKPVEAFKVLMEPKVTKKKIAGHKQGEGRRISSMEEQSE